MSDTTECLAYDCETETDWRFTVASSSGHVDEQVPFCTDCIQDREESGLRVISGYRTTDL